MSAAPPSLGPLPSQLSRVTIKWLSSPSSCTQFYSSSKQRLLFFSLLLRIPWITGSAKDNINWLTFCCIITISCCNRRYVHFPNTSWTAASTIVKSIDKECSDHVLPLGLESLGDRCANNLGCYLSKSQCQQHVWYSTRCLQMSWHSLVYRMLSPDLMSTPVSRGNGGLSRSREKSF